MELYLLTFNLAFGAFLIIIYLVGLVAWKYYDKKQRLFRKDIIKRVSRHVNSVRKGESHTNHDSTLESNPPVVVFPLSREEIYPFEKQETFHSHSHTPSSHRIRRSSIDYTHLHQSLHSSSSLHYDRHKFVKILWDLYELLPPMPYVSVLIQYMSDPVVFVERCSKIYGPCFSIYAWFGIKWTFMVGPDSNRIFFSDIEGKQSNLFNPMIDYSKASEMMNKPFERSDILPRNHQVCLPFISRRVRWQTHENEPELKEEPISKKQLLTEKEHLKQMLHEGFSSIQPLSEFVLENIRKEVKSSLFHLNHINLDFVDKNEMPAIAEADLETPKQLFGISEDIFSEGLKKQQFNDQVLVMGDVFSHMSRFVIKSILRSIFGSTFAKSHGDELSEIVSTLQVSCCDPLMICYFNFFRFKLLENFWVPNKVYEIELKKKRLHELLFREIERHVKIYQFNMSNQSSKKPCLKNAAVNNNAPKTYGCYMDYVLETLGPNLSKLGTTIDQTISLYSIHFEELILSIHKHEVTNLSWTICHLAQDQSLQDRVRKEIFQFQDDLKNQMTKLVSVKTNVDEYLSKFDHLNGVMNDNNFDEPREELLEGIHTLKKEDLDLLNKVNSLDETPPSFSANDISDTFASHTSLDTIPSESIGTLSSDPSSPIGFIPSQFTIQTVSNEDQKGTIFPNDQDTINYTEEQIITGELIPPHYLNARVDSPSTPPKIEQLTLPNMENLSFAAQAPMQSVAKSKHDDLNIETISPDLVHTGIVQKKLLFNALFVESVLSSSFDKQLESMHHSGLLKSDEVNLKLLDACFKESTRLYSLKFMTGKTTKPKEKPLRYFNYDLPSGQFVSIIPYFSHHSKEYFPFETHTYRPERFLELYHPEEKEETPTIQVTDHSNENIVEEKQLIHGGPSEVSELSFTKSDSIEEDRTLMNKLRVDQAFTQYGYVPCKSHQQIVKNNEVIESNTSVLLDTCLGCNFINISSRVFIIELLTHYKVEIPQWQKADVSSNRYFSSESHDCAFPIHPVAIILNPFL